MRITLYDMILGSVSFDAPVVSMLNRTDMYIRAVLEGETGKRNRNRMLGKCS